MAEKDIYLTRTLKQIPRLMGLLDRARESPTYGCFDRAYWHYRTKDFASAIPQYAALTLALTASLKEAAGAWSGDPGLREACAASLLFWARMQHADGSVPEAYPGDHSFAATAFSLYFIAEAYDRVGDAMDAAGRTFLTQRMRRAATFLLKAYAASGSRRGDTGISNHSAGAAAALYKMYEFSGCGEYKTGAVRILEDLLAMQSREGWFPEDAGADPGYASVSLYFLAHCRRLGAGEHLVPACARLVDFISYFVHPDGTVGGCYGSRETRLILPAGFEMMSGVVPAAGSIARLHRQAIRGKKTLVPEHFDDASLTCFYPAAYLEAYVHAGKDSETGPVLPVERPEPFSRYFPEAGLFVCKTRSCFAVISAKKGGVAEVYSKATGRLLLKDRGWTGRLRDAVVSSGLFDPRQKAQVGTDSITITRTFRLLGRAPLLSPLKTILLRIAAGLTAPVRPWRVAFKERLRSCLMRRSRPLPYALERTVTFDDKGLVVRDTLKGFHDGKVRGLGLSAVFTPVYCFTKGLSTADDGSAAAPYAVAPSPLPEELVVERRLDAVRQTVTTQTRGPGP